MNRFTARAALTAAFVGLTAGAFLAADLRLDTPGTNPASASFNVWVNGAAVASGVPSFSGDLDLAPDDVVAVQVTHWGGLPFNGFIGEAVVDGQAYGTGADHWRCLAGPITATWFAADFGDPAFVPATELVYNDGDVFPAVVAGISNGGNRVNPNYGDYAGDYAYICGPAQTANVRCLFRAADVLDDADGDGVPDASDNCPVDPNPGQADADLDGVGDLCEADSDVDGAIDDVDNCPTVFNADQSDVDGDGLGDACDADDDNDGVSDDQDGCPMNADPEQVDTDGDGQGDACDGDDDADGVADEHDLCPATPYNVALDADGCSGAQRVEATCGDGGEGNHGEYVSCVAHAAKDAQRAGLLSKGERAALVREAARR